MHLTNTVSDSSISHQLHDTNTFDAAIASRVWNRDHHTLGGITQIVFREHKFVTGLLNIAIRILIYHEIKALTKV
jgi:hypothetical protein